MNQEKSQQPSRILILGASGNFGKIISQQLVKEKIPLLIAARRIQPLQQLKQSLELKYPQANINYTQCLATYQNILQLLQKHKPLLLINASGPFQQASYEVAEACITAGVHYTDLADGREFVCGIRTLNDKACAANVSVISGASTVPALSSAVIESMLPSFSKINAIRYGIATGAKTPRGLATTQAILSYIGRPIYCKAKNFKHKTPYGWQNLYRQNYPELGARWMANCDIPDLDLFPVHYNIHKLQFSAGMQSSLLHLGIWLCSWLVRCLPCIKLAPFAASLLKFSHLFDSSGNADGGMHMIISGKDPHGKRLQKSWYIIAKNGVGINIPTIPSIYIAKQLSLGNTYKTGAYPCLGIVALNDYLQELDCDDICVYNNSHTPDTRIL